MDLKRALEILAILHTQDEPSGFVLVDTATTIISPERRRALNGISARDITEAWELARQAAGLPSERAP